MVHAPTGLAQLRFRWPHQDRGNGLWLFDSYCDSLWPGRTREHLCSRTDWCRGAATAFHPPRRNPQRRLRLAVDGATSKDGSRGSCLSKLRCCLSPSAIEIDERTMIIPTNPSAKKSFSMREKSRTAAPSVRQKTPSVRKANLEFSLNCINCFSSITEIGAKNRASYR